MRNRFFHYLVIPVGSLTASSEYCQEIPARGVQLRRGTAGVVVRNYSPQSSPELAPCRGILVVNPCRINAPPGGDLLDRQPIAKSQSQEFDPLPCRGAVGRVRLHACRLL